MKPEELLPICLGCGREMPRQKRKGIAQHAKRRFCAANCRHAFMRSQRALYFWAKVSQRPDSDCWEWRGATINGYGHFNDEGDILAHRWSLKKVSGLADDLHALHRCDNPKCVNPAHLYAGTHTDNMRDAVERRRFAAGENHPFRRARELCARGEKKVLTAKLTEAQVREIRASTESQRTIAARYGIHQVQVSKIRRRLAWAHVI